MSEKALTLDEVARKTELSHEDIRRSEQMGIVPAEKGEFTEQDLQTLSGIKCLQRMGLTLEDIAELNFSWASVCTRPPMLRKQSEAALPKPAELDGAAGATV